MADVDSTQVDALRRDLAKLAQDAPDLLADILEEVARPTLADVRARIPYRTGAAANSYRATREQTGVQFTYGGDAAPYVPVLEFQRAPAGGRYLNPAIEKNLADVEDRVLDAVEKAVE